MGEFTYQIRPFCFSNSPILFFKFAHFALQSRLFCSVIEHL